MATLFVIKGADQGKRFELNAKVIGIGRDTSNLIRLYDTEVSRRHAELRADDGGYVLVDLGSSNGTFVNNRLVREIRLQAGDQLQFGQTVILYTPGGSDSGDRLAERINMISRGDLEVPSAIVKAISEGEGSRLLAQPTAVEGHWLKNALANLSVIYQATQAVSHILDIDQLLDKIMDLIFQSIEADRGCIMLRNPDTGEFEPKAARWRNDADAQDRIVISRTIMDYVLQEQQGVLVSDACQDERFAPAPSIVQHGIRAALCVPMKGRHETVGVLYLDTQNAPQDIIRSGNPTGKFREDHLMLAIAIGHQAALALEDTRYHQALLQAERLAAVGQTIAAISHHIKNILQGLRSGSDLLKVGIEENNNQLVQQGWKIVEKNQRRIYDLVMDMLSYSKDREPLAEETDVNAVVTDVLELLGGRVRDGGIILQTRLADDLPTIYAEAEGLHRALLNIVGNALDALDNRDNPTLSLRTSLSPDRQWLQIEVTDNGVGIPPAKLEEIFKPFVSSKGSRGTGLGLAVSRKIIREHGGDILVHSQPGTGSRFTIRLPVQSPFQPAKETGELRRTLIPDDGFGTDKAGD